MKRFAALTLAFLILAASIFGCGVALAAQTEIYVFAAASMTEAMNEISGLYQKAHPDVKIVLNYDSSGTLKTQIEQGADCDIFISAAQKQMDQLDIKADPKANTGKLDFVAEGSRFNIVSNKVVLIVPKGANKSGISSFTDVAGEKVPLVVLGNSDVPVGQYSEQIFTHLGIWQKMNDAKKITFASNVKEVLAQVASGAAECGVVYSTDAATSNGVEIVAEAPAGSHAPITYPAAVLKKTKNRKAADDFVAFLKGPQATAVFKKIGFAIPEK